jgi:uncharacterized membrane protein
MMDDEITTQRVWTKVVGSAALGAAAMFVLDPDKGRRRRALARDKARWVARRTGEVVDAARRDVGGRWQGMRARTTRLLHRDGAVADEVLCERVRATLGRFVSHPHAVRVDARDGQVTLAGPILSHEEAALVGAVRAVVGVSGVDNRLERHESAENIPSLQGGAPRMPMRPELLQENWTPALRVGAVASGSLLALWGLRRGGASGLLMALIGAAFATRGAMNAPLSSLAGARGPRAVDLTKTIDVAAPPDAVFDMWTRYENFPQFMSHVQSVTDLGDGKSHWIVEGPGGTTVEWDAAITRMVAGRAIEWRSEPGSTIEHAGSVRFDATDGGTRITVRVSYNAAGAIGHGIAALLGADPRQRIDDDLMRMKTFIETGRRPRDAAAGERTAALAPPPLVQPGEPDVPPPTAQGPTMSGTPGA